MDVERILRMSEEARRRELDRCIESVGTDNMLILAKAAAEYAKNANACQDALQAGKKFYCREHSRSRARLERFEKHALACVEADNVFHTVSEHFIHK